jgi:hypothetical protein
MTAPEVQFVLDAIKDHYGTSPLSNIPLERIDRDNSDLLDDTPVHEHSVELEEMNYVGAASAGTSSEPIGTEFDHRTETTVSVRVEGAHVDEFGAIDPQSGTNDAASVSYPTTDWQSLTDNIRRAILTDRTFPDPDRNNITYKDLFIENWSDQAANFSDYYRLDFDVRFSGFETLP